MNDSILCVVVATVAFGMRLDCPDVHRIMHWGPSTDIEEYLQETGRAGRDGSPSTATLFVTDLKSHSIEDAMKSYMTNKSVCRRQVLIRNFESCNNESNDEFSMCKCCDFVKILVCIPYVHS